MKYNSEPGTNLTHKWVFVNKMMPWYRYNGQAPRYIPMQKCTLKYYYVGQPPSANTYTQRMDIWAPPSMDANCICKKINYCYSAYLNPNYHWSTEQRGCIPLDEFNDNKFFSDWVPNVPVYVGDTASGGGVGPGVTSGNFVSGGNTEHPGDITLYRANEIPPVDQMDPKGYYIV